MKKRSLPLVMGLLPLTALVLTAGAPGYAQTDYIRPDYELAREAVQRGEILPLARVIDQVQKSYPGTVIEVELEFDADGVEYELELATPDGRILDIDVDAVTGKIISVDEDD